ncbi:DUF2244 domain-containing protein [Pigmentiphaga aceris]|nr:DUF2244 domain-containing protein [Pigmentiphaga aceris]
MLSATDPPPADPAPALGWSLRRRFAITPRSFMQAYAIHGVISGAIAICFGLMQLWVIVAFCMLQVGVVSACYVHFALHAFDGESIRMADDGNLEVEVVRGRDISFHQFNPAWTRVERGGKDSARLYLCSGNQRVEVGHFLTPVRRHALERELRRALRQFR